MLQTRVTAECNSSKTDLLFWEGAGGGPQCLYRLYAICFKNSIATLTKNLAASRIYTSVVKDVPTS